ncbi:MAG: chlorite dismutase family protein [Hyphomicrobium aestuarii]|nr:chlorite dismutase family protein [Hyphomicrobium aestuarii]
MTRARGDGLPPAAWVDVSPAGAEPEAGGTAWTLAGLMSNVRYATRTEVTALRERQEPLGRTDARCAALIPIRKSPAWWALAQDERRAIFEEASHHTAIGMDYLPAIARQLFHSRDIAEPFDFLTWFEFAPEHAAAFEELVGNLRATAEWTYVEREIDIRLERA